MVNCTNTLFGEAFALVKFLVIGDLPLATQTFRMLRSDPRCEVLAVMTQFQDREFRNDPWMDKTPLYEAARACGLPIYHSQADLLRDFPPASFDYGVSCRASIIYKPDFLRLFEFFMINMHGGVLPSRGGLHISCHCIIEGDSQSGGTLHVIDEGIDTGDILARKRFDLLPQDTAFTVYQKTQLALFDLFGEFKELLLTNSFSRTPQQQFIEQGETRTYFKKDAVALRKEINPKDMSPEEIDRRVRGLDFPGHEPAYMLLDGRKIYLTTQRFFEYDNRN